jgi:hypothetical protein
MKKLIYISFIFAFVLAFASCEKEVIAPFSVEEGDRSSSDGPMYRGGEDGGDLSDGDHTKDPITDPDEDEDFDDDNIVDPDEDEDFDEEEGGK